VTGYDTRRTVYTLIGDVRMRPTIRLSRVRTVLLAAIAITSASSCGEPTPPFGVVAAVVYGNVTHSSGLPAVGARVAARASRGGCSNDGISTTFDLTDAQGFYRTRFVDAVNPGDACVTVIVAPGGAGVTDTLRVTGPTISLRVAGGSQPEDSARVDVRLPN
jgi:hypothetical protein